MSREQSNLPLSHYRVLDLTNALGVMCGRILGDLGADVIKIEMPCGDQSRNIGPFFHDEPDPEKSLFWFAFNANKRGVTLNIESKDGREIFERLAKSADFIIESFPPGHLDDLSLGYSRLSEINPKIIFTAITPFGQSGPYREYKGCDIVYEALGGFMAGTGEPDRAPLRISVDQAFLEAGTQAAAASMIAHYHRMRTGEGQFIDVSTHEAVAAVSILPSIMWGISKVNVQRQGHFAKRGNVTPRIIFPCKDGYISWRIWVAGQGSRTKAMVGWMNSEGIGTELKEIDWKNLDFNDLTDEQINFWEGLFSEFFLTHTKAEIYKEAGNRGAIVFPVSDFRDLSENAHLEARGFWSEIKHPELKANITYPGVIFKSSEFDCGVRFRAPLIGEHNEEIYIKELRFSEEDLVALKEAGVI